MLLLIALIATFIRNVTTFCNVLEYKTVQIGGDMNLLIIGFSITEEKNGYVKELEEKLKSNTEVLISSKAIGGVTFQLLPYILPSILENKVDHIIFEIASCYRFENSVDKYLILLEEISNICISKEISFSFVNLFRENIDYDSDLLTLSISSFALKRNIPVLNLFQYINKNNKTEFLRDGIHTNKYGANFYAEKILDFINHKIVNNTNSFKKIIPISQLVCSVPFEIKTFSRGNVEFEYGILKAGVNYEFLLQEPVLINGIIHIQGPKSGVCQLLCPEVNFSRNIHMYDEHCYYSRYSSQFIPEAKIKKINLLQSEAIPSIQLRKGTKDESEREAHIIGFLVKD